jgi:hypothetical protein
MAAPPLGQRRAVMVRLLIIGAVLATMIACSSDPTTGSCPDGSAPPCATPDPGRMPDKSDAVFPEKSWTLMFYGAADNSLAADILKNVNELEAVGSSDDVNLVAFYDSPDGAFRAYLQRDEDLSQIRSAATDLGRIDSGVPETLIEFASWAMMNYPAQNYGLIISSHGEGALRQTALDDTSHHAVLLSSLGVAIGTIQSLSGRRLVFLGIDACLMQTVETAFELRDSIDTLVASENFESGPGWDYPSLATALRDRPTQSAAELAAQVVSDFGMKYATVDWLTLAAVDTASMAALTPALSALGRALRAFMERDQESFGQAETTLQNAARADGFYADLVNLTQLLQTDVPDTAVRDAASEVEQLARATITRSFISTNIAPDQSGLSVFVPLYLEVDTLAAYRTSSFARASEWDEFIGWWYQIPTD